MEKRRDVKREALEPTIHSLDELLKSFLRRSDVMPRLKFGRLQDAWNEAAGPEVARQSRVAGFAKGKLLIEVSSSTLLHQLRSYRQAEIMARFRTMPNVSDVVSIQFKLVGPFRGGNNVER